MSLRKTVAVAVVFTESSCKSYDCKWLYSQTPPSLRATSPNLGEEPDYSAHENINDKLTC